MFLKVLINLIFYRLACVTDTLLAPGTSTIGKVDISDSSEFRLLRQNLFFKRLEEQPSVDFNFSDALLAQLVEYVLEASVLHTLDLPRVVL
mmetsp:Transcript_33821/g.44673  ORF Transcript_33821/g.44673 Transcript_33821/m.44673 type:complete len:91 (-) Transcript_33821:337-609(-)